MIQIKNGITKHVNMDVEVGILAHVFVSIAST